MGKAAEWLVGGGLLGSQLLLQFLIKLQNSSTGTIPYSGKTSRTINFAVLEDFTTASKINSSKTYYSIECYDSLVYP